MKIEEIKNYLKQKHPNITVHSYTRNVNETDIITRWYAQLDLDSLPCSFSDVSELDCWIKCKENIEEEEKIDKFLTGSRRQKLLDLLNINK